MYTDRQYLIWIHARLNRAGEDLQSVPMIRLREIINNVPVKQESPYGNDPKPERLDDLFALEYRSEADDICPVCSSPSIGNCRCMLRDSQCKNHHSWYYCPRCKAKIVGESDHGRSTMDQVCEICIYSMPKYKVSITDKK